MGRLLLLRAILLPLAARAEVWRSAVHLSGEQRSGAAPGVVPLQRLLVERGQPVVSARLRGGQGAPSVAGDAPLQPTPRRSKKAAAADTASEEGCISATLLS